MIVRYGIMKRKINIFLIGLLSVLQAGSIFLLPTLLEDGEFSESGWYVVYIFIAQFLACTFLIVYNFKVILRSNIIIKLFLLYGLIILAFSSIYLQYSIKDFARALVFSSTSVFSLISFYAVLKNDRNAYRAILGFNVVLFILSIFMYLKLYAFTTYRSGFATIKDIYYIFLYFPWLMLLRGGGINYLSVIGFGLVVIFAAKRGAFLAYILSSAMFFGVKNFVAKNRNEIIFLLFAPFILLLVIFVVYRLSGDSFNFLIDRFSNIETDQGSGRVEMWSYVLDRFGDGSFFNKIFGTGYYGIRNALILGDFEELSPHNDFLQILYNYGIVGFFIHILIYVYSFAFQRKLIIRKSAYAPVFALMLTIYFLMMMVSTIFNAPGFSFTLLSFFGFILAAAENEQAFTMNIYG